MKLSLLPPFYSAPLLRCLPISFRYDLRKRRSPDCGDCLEILVIMLIVLYGQTLGGHFIDAATFGPHPDMLPFYDDAVDEIAVQ